MDRRGVEPRRQGTGIRAQADRLTLGPRFGIGAGNVLQGSKEGIRLLVDSFASSGIWSWWANRFRGSKNVFPNPWIFEITDERYGKDGSPFVPRGGRSDGKAASCQ